MSELSVHTIELIGYQKKILNYIDREKKLKEIYDQANRLIAVLIECERSVDYNDLMGALAEFDGGSWDTEKMFPDYK